MHRTTIRNPSWKLAVFMEGEAHHPGTDFGVHFNHLLSQMVAANPSDAATPNAKVSRERSRPENADVGSRLERRLIRSRFLWES